MSRRLLVLPLVALLLASGPGAAPAAAQAGAGYVDLSPAEVAALLAEEDPFLLDVHVPNEGYLAGTDARIPFTEVAARQAELPADPDERIVVYCLSGRMGEIAADELVGLGYRNVVNLAGGMLAWRAAGYELVPE
jgi:phage shock protein E